MKLGSIAFGLVLCTSFVGSVVACGDSAEEEAAKQKAQTESEQQEAFLDQYCQIVLPCCNKVLKKPIDDVAGCKAYLRQMDPVTIGNKDARDACITQSKAAAPDPHFCPDFAQAETPACPDITRGKLTGTKKPGEVCTTDAECAPDFTGIVTCSQGICQLRKHGAEGDGPCDTTVDGDVVLPLPNPSTEATVFTCYRGGSKAENLQCDAKSMKCVTALGDREQCTDSTQCAKDHFCDKDEQRCFAKLVKNSKCDDDFECKGHCKKDSGDEDTGGFCEDQVGEDEDCETTQWCNDGLDCVSGKCTKPGPDQRLNATCNAQ